MRKDNQGVTLIELIVVIIILGILAGGAFLGIRSLDSGNVQSSVKRIDALLDYVRVQNMSKDKTYYLLLEEVSGDYFARVQYPEDSSMVEVLSERLKLKNGTITFFSETSTGAESEKTIDSDVTPAVTMQLSFRKESGALEAGSDGYVRRIVVSSAGRTYTIYLVKATGKHYIE